MTERPDPSDFREEQEEAAYQQWCTEHGMDPDESETAYAYEDWFFDEYQHEDWFPV